MFEPAPNIDTILLIGLLDPINLYLQLLVLNHFEVGVDEVDANMHQHLGHQPVRAHFRAYRGDVYLGDDEGAQFISQKVSGDGGLLHLLLC